MNRMIYRIFGLMPSKLYLKMKYKNKIGKKLDFKDPKTFNAKIQWLKINDKNDLYTTLVDKYEVKKYVAEKNGEEYVIPTLGVYNNFDEIDFDKLPNQFVIKCTHNSGGIVVVKNKKGLDIEKAKKKINECLKENYYYRGREYPYKNVKPRIIVEEYMEDKNSDELVDYKVMCFNGKAKMIFTCTERFGDGLKVTFFDLNWERLPFERHYPASQKTIPKPKNLQKMIEFSEKLAEGIPFVRMDWYEINGKLYFGEYTFYPGGGMEEFTPEEWDEKVGEMLNLEQVRK